MSFHVILLIASFFIFSEKSLTDYEFIEISDVLITENGIYVADVRMRRIYHFSKDGTLLNYTGISGRGPGEYNMGPNILIGTSDLIYVFDKLPNALNIYDKNLELVEVIADREMFFPALSGFQYADSLLFLVSSPISFRDFGKYNMSGGLIEEITIPDRTGFVLRDMFKGFMIGDDMVLVWTYINRMDTINLEGERLHTCKMPDLPDEIKYEIMHFDIPTQKMTKNEAEIFNRGTYIPYGTLIRNTVQNKDKLAVQYGSQFNEDRVLFFNNRCEIKGEMSLSKSKMIRGIDQVNEKLYYSYNHNDYDRIGVMELKMEPVSKE